MTRTSAFLADRFVQQFVDRRSGFEAHPLMGFVGLLVRRLEGKPLARLVRNDRGEFAVRRDISGQKPGMTRTRA